MVIYLVGYSRTNQPHGDDCEEELKANLQLAVFATAFVKFELVPVVGSHLHHVSHT